MQGIDGGRISAKERTRDSSSARTSHLASTTATKISARNRDVILCDFMDETPAQDRSFLRGGAIVGNLLPVQEYCQCVLVTDPGAFYDLMESVQFDRIALSV